MTPKLRAMLLVLSLLAAACGSGGGGKTTTPTEQFVPQLVDFLSDAGRSPSLAVDKDGLPHLAYLGLNQKLKGGEIAAARPLTLPVLPAVLTADQTKDGLWNHGSVIATKNVSDPLPLKKTDEVALVVDDKGNQDVAFTMKGDLNYVTAAPGSEFGDPEKIASGSVLGLSIDAAPDGTPWVTWFHGGDVMAATKPGKTWTVETVAKITGRAALPARTAVQAGLPDSPYIVFTDARGAGPTLARRANGGWETVRIDPGGGGYGISMALDNSGNPHVTYYTSSGEVRHAHSISGSPWEISTIGKSGTSPDPGWSASIGLDKKGTHSIAWYDSSENRVRLSSNSTGDFKEIPVSGTENGELPRVGVAPDGSTVYVAWYDDENADLVVGTYGVNGPPSIPDVVLPTTAGASPTGAPPAQCQPSGNSVAVVAQGIAFDTDCLAAPAGQAFTIEFDNKDAGVPHNFDVLDAAGGKHLFGAQPTDLLTGPGKTKYKVTPQKAGSYYFQCDVHPTTMFGTFVVK